MRRGKNKTSCEGLLGFAVSLDGLWQPFFSLLKAHSFKLADSFSIAGKSDISELNFANHSYENKNAF